MHSHTQVRLTGSLRVPVTVLLVALFAALGAPFALGGTANVNVDLDVPAVITLNTASCATGSAGVTNFGTITVGSSVVTTSDCTITFGASNNTAMLRINQTDKLGTGMWMPSTGTLDSEFDADGKVTTAIAPGVGTDLPYAMAVQPDGKIITGGFCDMGGSSGWDFCIARYTTSGTLDTTFDTDGQVTTPIAPGSASEWARGVAVQRDGKIVAAGACDIGGSSGRDFCLARYTSTGALDTTFDSDGKITTPIAPGTNSDEIRSVVLQPDGKVIAAGACDMGAGATGADFCLARYTSTGALDTTFDSDGKVTTPIASGNGGDTGVSAALQPDGKLVIVGWCSMGGATGADFCLARYTSTGTLDTTFDTDGILNTGMAPGSSWDEGLGAALQSDGKIIAAGWCEMGGTTGWDICLARYTTTGVLDTTFDGDGKATASIAPGTGTDEVRGVMLQPDGKIVTAGRCEMGATSGWDICLARFTASGTLDATFDIDGKLSTAIAPGAGIDYGWSVGIRPDGKILSAGRCDMGGATGNDFCLASFAAGGSFLQHVNGTSDWDQGQNMFGACLRALSGGTAGWTTNATCPSTDGAYWNDIPTTPEKVANTTATGNITANFRFGLRTASNQPPGAYIAPITFDVLAPNA
jgi:uncharacterized delta-60 repeat protein